jgi:hypothetical protein
MRMKYSKTLLLILLLSSQSYAGPPFVTDDPQPVDYKHWELYIASGQSFSENETIATLPHMEFNYGIIPEVQLHIILPMEYSHIGSTSKYRFSNTELGIKYRFVDETESRPQMGVFPLLELPTESNSGDERSKSIQAFFPLWIQKSWGDFTIYGGGGYWLNPGSDKKNSLLLGWEAQYNFSKALTLGGELFYQTPEDINSTASTSFNIGGYINLTDENHLLFSLGHTLNGDNVTTGYIAYQLTI